MGFSTEGRLPVRRGYNHSLGFLGGGEDHYKQTAGACPGLGPTVDLWEDTAPVRSNPLFPLTASHRDRVIPYLSRSPS